METIEKLIMMGLVLMSFSIWGVIIWKMLFVNHDAKNEDESVL
jgi:biopolymer transport protein ExbB/TolQ